MRSERSMASSSQLICRRNSSGSDSRDAPVGHAALLGLNTTTSKSLRRSTVEVCQSSAIPESIEPARNKRMADDGASMLFGDCTYNILRASKDSWYRRPNVTWPDLGNPDES